MEHVTDITRIIQLAVAPVFLLTAIGTILSALNNRLGRIVDRRRVLLDRARRGDTGDAEGRKADDFELGLLARRIGLIYHSIVMAIFCALFICLVVASAFVGVFVVIGMEDFSIEVGDAGLEQESKGGQHDHRRLFLVGIEVRAALVGGRSDGVELGAGALRPDLGRADFVQRIEVAALLTARSMAWEILVSEVPTTSMTR